MSDTKTLAEWETELNFMIKDATEAELNTQLTDQEAYDLHNTGRGVGVFHEMRKEFLVKNGYDVTRENMINADLSDVVTPNADVDRVEIQEPAANGTDTAQEV